VNEKTQKNLTVLLLIAIACVAGYFLLRHLKKRGKLPKNIVDSPIGDALNDNPVTDAIEEALEPIL